MLQVGCRPGQRLSQWLCAPTGCEVRPKIGGALELVGEHGAGLARGPPARHIHKVVRVGDRHRSDSLHLCTWGSCPEFTWQYDWQLRPESTYLQTFSKVIPAWIYLLLYVRSTTLPN